MAIRVFTCRGLLWEDLIRQKVFTTSGKLPPILSVVVYTGDRPWTGPTSVLELIEPLPDAPEGSDPLSYRLIEEQRYPASKLDAEESPVSGLFLVERRGDPKELIRTARKMARGLPGAGNRPLREALGTYVGYRLRKLSPTLELPQNIDLLEVPPMLEQRVTEWTEQWKRDGMREGRREGMQEGMQEGRREGMQEGRREGMQEGRREGMQEGRREGLREGEARLLMRLLEQKFGPVPAGVRTRVASADADQLLEWGERLLVATNLKAVFAVPTP